MTDQRSPRELEDLYVGELSPRRPAVAFWLSLLAPGLGWLYTGQLGGAIATNLIMVSFWGFFLAAWTLLKFFPVVPVLVFGAGWSAIMLMNAIDAARAASARRERYVEREVNQPLVYGAVFVFSFALPLFGIAHLATHGLWQRVVVHGDAMYPSLLDGDHLILDRSAYRRIPPTHGDIVVYEAPDTDSLLMGRVIGLPGDEVVIDHDLFTNSVTIVRVNEEVYVRAPVSPDDEEVLERRVGAIDATATLYVEDNGAQLYPITASTTSSWAQPTTLMLAEGEYVVINDNRSDLHDSRSFGPITEDAIRGMPLFVEVSGEGSWIGLLFNQATGADPVYRRERFGRRVQLPLYLRPEPVAAEEPEE